MSHVTLHRVSAGPIADSANLGIPDPDIEQSVKFTLAGPQEDRYEK